MRIALLTRWSLRALVAAFAFAVVGGHADARRRSPAPPSTGLPAIAFAKAPPDFGFETGAGPAHLDQYVGKPVVINFWATWCGPCRDELAAFADLRTTYGDRVPLLTISWEEPGVARAMLAARHVDSTAIDDPQKKIFELYSVSAIPVTLVLAPDGTVTHVSVGELDWAELQAAVDPLLSREADGTRLDPRPQI